MKTKRSTAGGGMKRNKKRTAARKANPFELKFNRNKHKVLGRGSDSVAVGAPTLSKKKAFENRLNSLAVELRQFGKSNKIVDRRLGERDLHMTQEDRLVKRFTAERLKAFKSNKFQLADPQDEELTHKGSALTSVEKYDRTVSDEDDDGGGEMDADVVATAHFGGGLPESVDDKTEQKYARRKDLIAELIAKTKQQRYDKQMARDEQEDMTNRLDEQWKKLMHTGAMNHFTNMPSSQHKDHKAADDEYDLLLCELKMDSGKRGEAAERQKTEEEIAKDEQLKLIELEKARIARMEGYSTEVDFVSPLLWKPFSVSCF
ncbi:Nucleolar protein 14 [Toxocara canis]|uniref:Nucleolar protein 14 n=1 Tax=Toxocara canis TaxID=6265 RepID=A0A0B2V7Q9_TOXCA|nr:Nucleolar protein 14 [Toxocara canis]